MFLGSPPHMRGKAKDEFLEGVKWRITPAHAGKRDCNGSEKIRYWDHPRTCGEKKKHHQFCHNFRGSPPHMRGKVSSVSSDGDVVSDHPRTCGEKHYEFCVRIDEEGSPPHMRGKVTDSLYAKLAK